MHYDLLLQCDCFASLAMTKDRFFNTPLLRGWFFPAISDRRPATRDKHHPHQDHNQLNGLSVPTRLVGDHMYAYRQKTNCGSAADPPDLTPANLTRWQTRRRCKSPSDNIISRWRKRNIEKKGPQK
jgi:hypothetical protein